jgi:hypothetical protein
MIVLNVNRNHLTTNNRSVHYVQAIFPASICYQITLAKIRSRISPYRSFTPFRAFSYASRFGHALPGILIACPVTYGNTPSIWPGDTRSRDVPIDS